MILPQGNDAAMHDAKDTDATLQSMELLASAVAGRVLRMATAADDEPSWTDGKTVFVDSRLNQDDQLISVLVQACLLAAGSLAPDLLRGLGRDARLARRYLAIEAPRALNAHAALLPPLISGFLAQLPAQLHESPAASLEHARRARNMGEPPRIFGTIQARRLLKSAGDSTQLLATEQLHTPRRPRMQDLAGLDDESEQDDNSSSAAVDMFSVAGGSGALGRWLQKLLRAVRQGQGEVSGSPGIDAATHHMRFPTKRGAGAVMSSATLDNPDTSDNRPSAYTYPEWDMFQRRYKPNWCSVQEIDPPQKECAEPAAPNISSLRRPLARLGLGLDRCHRQSQGDDIDIDAAIEARIEMLAGSIPEETVYVDSLRRRRDLSVLVLLDISGSVGESGADGRTIHEQQRAAAAAITSTLHTLGDRVALYAYSSQGRSTVQLTPVKRFDDHFNGITMRHLHSLVPGAYSRLGAAIRHGAALLQRHGGTSRRLLLVLSDGLAYDHGYERDYGAADARRALSEVRRRGIGCLCLTIGANTDAESLKRVFGTAAHATIAHNSQLGDIVGALFRMALRSAEVRRKVS
jgi:nitric oxide reductase NorD protein